MKIFSAVLIAAFGQGRQFPKRATIQKLILLTMLSLGLSICLAYNARTLHIPRWPPSAILFLAITLGIQISIVASLMGSRTIMSSQNTISRLLTILPLGRLQRWLLIWLPQFVLVACVLIALVPSLFVVKTSLGTTSIGILGSVILGTLSACGMMFGATISYSVRTLAIAITVSAELWLTNHGINIAYSIHQRMPYILAQVIVLALLCGNLKRIPDTVSSSDQHTWLPSRTITSSAWFITKLLRSYTGSRSLLYTLCISSLVTLASTRIFGVDAHLLYGAASLLIASCTADLRCLSQTHRPPEIVAIRGTISYCWAQLGAMLFASLTVIPIVVAAIRLAPTAHDITWGLLEIIIGGLAGSLAGTILAHEGRDISSQFAGVLLSIGILWLIQTALSLPSRSPLMQYLGGIVSIMSLFGTLTAVEYNRNPFRWRNRNESYTSSK